MVIGPKIEKNFLHFSTFHDPLIPKNAKKRNFFCTFLYVCMSRPKSLNISRSPSARALILVSKHFYIWGIDAIKIVSELVGGGGGVGVIPIFHFFEILKNFSFLGLSREPFEIRWCTRGQKSFHS